MTIQLSLSDQNLDRKRAYRNLAYARHWDAWSGAVLRPSFPINGSHPVRRFRTHVAFTIHLYGLPTYYPDG